VPARINLSKYNLNIADSITPNAHFKQEDMLKTHILTSFNAD